MSEVHSVSGERNFTGARYQPLVVILLAFCVGVLLDRTWPLSAVVWWIAALVALAAWLVVWLFRLERTAAFLLVISLTATGGTWHHLFWHVFAADDLGRCAREEAQPVYVEVKLLTNPRVAPAPPNNPMRTIPKGDWSETEVAIVNVRDGDRWRSASGNATLTIDGHLVDLRAGDRVRVFAQLTAPSPPRNPGDFDFARHERTERHLCGLFAEHPACITVISNGSTWSPRRLLYDVRGRGDTLLSSHLSPRRAALASAVLLGEREQLDPDRTEDFFTTGTIHLLAISGLHVGILVYFFWLAARGGVMPRQWTFVAAIVFVILYALLTDARPPVVRAAVLIVALCVGRLIGRQTFSFNTLAAAGLFVLMMNPAQLFQTGTQLSFLAVATLAVCGPYLLPKPPQDPLERLIANTRPWPERVGKRLGGAVWRLWLTSTLIWLVALPLIVYQFNLVSPVAVVLNPLLMIPIAVALFSGFGVLLFGWLIPPVGVACGWICDASFLVIESGIHAGRPVAGSHFWWPEPQWWWVAGFYAALAIAVAVPRLRPRWYWEIVLLSAWIAIGFCGSTSAQRTLFSRHDQLDCTFVAVGHGTSVLIELPDGRTVLYDAGRMGSPTAGMRAITAVLWSRGITHLDAVIISHADADHYNAMPELMERVSVGVVYVSPMMFDDETPALAVLRQSIEQAGVPIRPLHADHRLETAPSVNIEVLHPPARGVLGSDNANSIVLLVEFSGRRILLPGDLESPGMEDVLAEEPLDCDVAMAPHHGSARSNPRGFAAWSKPEYVVISGGNAREAEQVMTTFRESNANVVHTAESGAVRVTIRANDVQVRSWRNEPW